MRALVRRKDLVFHGFIEFPPFAAVGSPAITMGRGWEHLIRVSMSCSLVVDSCILVEVWGFPHLAPPP